jgi:hypothetical protein
MATTARCGVTIVLALVLGACDPDEPAAPVPPPAVPPPTPTAAGGIDGVATAAVAGSATAGAGDTTPATRRANP